jgi:hypothetical protein
MSKVVKGVHELIQNLDKLIKNHDKAVHEGMIEGAEIILEQSNKLAPKDTGLMVRESEVVENGKDVEIRYNTDYSLYVHEDMAARHTNGQAKFLEQAGIDKQREVLKVIADKVKRVKR